MSGQVGTDVYGNRSYTEEPDSTQSQRKTKNGYYITINIHISEKQCKPNHNIFLIRFGWVDHEDWEGQKASTGQAAVLSDEAYEHKLVAICGEYLLDAPLELAYGIGPKTIESGKDFLEENQISTIEGFLRSYRKKKPDNSALERIYNSCMKYPANSINTKVVR